MAEKTHFYNPYNFVPVNDARVERSLDFNTQEKYRGYSGRMKIKLETLTPLFIPDRRKDANCHERSEEFAWDEPIEILKKYRNAGEERLQTVMHPHYAKFLQNEKKQKIIPASSLKGMLRCYAEALSNSCLTLDTGRYKERRRGDFFEAKFGDLAHSQCTLEPNSANSEAGLCLCCRIFGLTSGESDDNKEAAGNLKGRVYFDDAILDDECKNDKVIRKDITLDILGEPKPRHKPFYFKGPDYSAVDQIRGRKFYCHYEPDLQKEMPKKSHLNSTIQEHIAPAAIFWFEVQFENLSEEELALLLYSIVLTNKNKGDDDFMAHKIGMAKPLGFGSVHLKIDELKYYNNKAAYNNFAPRAEVLKPQSSEEEMKKLCKLLEKYPNPIKTNPNRFDVWKYPKKTGNFNVYYPGQAWFKADRDAPRDNKKRHPLPNDGKLPMPWSEPDDSSPEKENLSKKLKELKEKALEATVLEAPKGRIAKCKIQQSEKLIDVICTAKNVHEGDIILVNKNEKGVYIQYSERR